MYRQFIEKKTQLTLKHLKRSIVLKRREKCKLKLHWDTIFPIRLSKIQKVNNTLCWWGWEEIGILKHSW